MRIALRRFMVLGVALCFLAGHNARAEKGSATPNFYTDEPASKPDAKKAQPKADSKTKTPARAPRKDSDKTAARTAAVKPKSQAKAVVTKEATHRGLTNGPPYGSFPYDPYHLAGYMARRWDLIYLIPSGEERRNWRANALKGQATALERASGQLEDAMVRRSRNAGLALRALAIVAAARHTQSSPFEPDRLAPHAAALIHTWRADSTAATSVTEYGELIRGALNSVTDALVQAERQSGSGDPKETAMPFDSAWKPSVSGYPDASNQVVRRGVTIALADEARACYASMASESIVDDSVLEAILAANIAGRSRTGGATLRSLAPAGPGPELTYVPIVDASTPLPQLPSVDEIKPVEPERPLETLERHGVFVAAAGAHVIAPLDGTVAYADTLRGYGLTVILQHDGDWFSVCSSMGTISVTSGQALKKGDLLGTAGAVSRHAQRGIHFEVRQGVTAVDPQQLLKTEQFGALLFR